jgi:hypothetical protein
MCCKKLFGILNMKWIYIKIKMWYWDEEIWILEKVDRWIRKGCRGWILGLFMIVRWYEIWKVEYESFRV